MEPFPCRCVWQGARCPKPATQEDGLCDWCGVRTEDDLRDNPFTVYAANGEYMGLAGGTITGYIHQAGMAGISDDVRPTACWFPDSGRTLAPPPDHSTDPTEGAP